MPQNFIYTLDAADTVTNESQTITRQTNDHEFVKQMGVGDQPEKRFFKARIDVEPTAKP